MVERQVAQILIALQEAVEKHGPGALKVALQVLRIEAIFHLIFGLFALVGIILTIRWLRRVWRDLEDDSYSDTDEKMLKTLGGAIVLLILGIVFLATWGEVRTWMAAYDPRLALAYDILQKLTRMVK